MRARRTHPLWHAVAVQGPDVRIRLPLILSLLPGGSTRDSAIVTATDGDVFKILYRMTERQHCDAGRPQGQTGRVQPHPKFTEILPATFKLPPWRALQLARFDRRLFWALAGHSVEDT